jgi:hypothetical protein
MPNKSIVATAVAIVTLLFLSACSSRGSSAPGSAPDVASSSNTAPGGDGGTTYSLTQTSALIPSGNLPPLLGGAPWESLDPINFTLCDSTYGDCGATAVDYRPTSLVNADCAAMGADIHWGVSTYPIKTPVSPEGPVALVETDGKSNAYVVQFTHLDTPSDVAKVLSTESTLVPKCPTLYRTPTSSDGYQLEPSVSGFPPNDLLLITGGGDDGDTGYEIGLQEGNVYITIYQQVTNSPDLPQLEAVARAAIAKFK